MRVLMLMCAALLFAGLAYLPIGYYTFVRIVVTIGAVVAFVKEMVKGLTFWCFVFGAIGILFNPLIPIYFNSKSTWVLIDVITGAAFVVKGIKAVSLKSAQPITNL